jgi:hypothetical protein
MRTQRLFLAVVFTFASVTCGTFTAIPQESRNEVRGYGTIGPSVPDYGSIARKVQTSRESIRLPVETYQALNEAFLILYDAHMQKHSLSLRHWLYDSKPMTRRNYHLIVGEDERVNGNVNNRYGIGKTGLPMLTYVSLADEINCAAEIAKQVVDDPSEISKSVDEWLLRQKNSEYETKLTIPDFDVLRQTTVQHIYYLNNVIVDEIRWRRFADLYQFTLIGTQDIYCEDAKGHYVVVSPQGRYQRFDRRSCAREIELVVTEQKFERFKSVLAFIFNGDVCKGAKRTSRF